MNFTYFTIIPVKLHQLNHKDQPNGQYLNKKDINK